MSQQNPAEPLEENAGSSILIIDDNPNNLAFITHTLEKTGFNCVIVSDGESGIQHARTEKPDLILLDVLMPGLDGYETCRLIKREQETCDIPIIFMTGLTDTEDMVRAFKEGGIDYLVKPLDSVELLTRINTHLKIQKLSRALQQKNEELTTTNALLRNEITGRKKAQAELQEAHGDLEEKVLLRTQRLNEINRKLENEIIERKRSEEALMQSEERYRTLFENSPVAIWEEDYSSVKSHLDRFGDEMKHDPERFFEENPKLVVHCRGLVNVIDINQAAVRLHNAESKEELLKNTTRIFTPESYMTFSLQLRALVKGETLVEYNTVLETLDGESRHVSIRWSVPPDYEKHYDRVLVSMMDMSELQKAQDQLIQADKMVSIGTLVAGVAHEINNPNTSIAANAPLLRRIWTDILAHLEKDERVDETLTLAGLPFSKVKESVPRLISGISDGSDRIQKIVDDLKDFVRSDNSRKMESINLNRVTESALSLLHYIVKKATSNFAVSYDDNLPEVIGNYQQIEQVIINLITNACQSLTVKEQGIYINTSHNAAKGYVMVSVRDEGRGIPEKELKYITDPFFTTKRDSGGTGLGLSLSYQIIHKHGGTIEFVSQEGVGTTVTINLPTGREG